MQTYLNGIISIANSFPKVKFLVFTKNNSLNFDIDIPQNLNIRFSMWKNFENLTTLQTCSWIEDDPRILNKKIFHCLNDCRKCAFCWNSKKDVVFQKH